MNAYLVYLDLMESTFFASREISNFYETEGLIGNYALCYALGWAFAPYRTIGGPSYRNELSSLNKKGIYVTPASPIGEVRFSLSFFNALSDAYWYEMAQNVVNVEKGKKARAINYPQQGRIKQLSIGNRFRFAVFSEHPLSSDVMPPYIRLGKWMSKAKLSWHKVTLKEREADGGYITHLFINSVDLLEKDKVERFDLTGIYPAPILRNVLYQGSLYFFRDNVRGEDIAYPRGIRFGGNLWQE